MVKVASVRQATEGVPVESSLPPSPAVFNKFEPYTAEAIRKIISATAAKSCSLDPLPTHVMKEFLPELLPFIVDRGMSASQPMSCNRYTASKETRCRSDGRQELSTNF